ncbi:hypothetical protein FQZ97_1072050 [compost metagenome]
MQGMPAFAIHPVEPFGTVVGFMQTPQPRHVMAEPVHGIETEVQNHCSDEQLAPQGQLCWEGANRIRHPITQSS